PFRQSQIGHRHRPHPLRHSRPQHVRPKTKSASTNKEHRRRQPHRHSYLPSSLGNQTHPRPRLVPLEFFSKSLFLHAALAATQDLLANRAHVVLPLYRPPHTFQPKLANQEFQRKCWLGIATAAARRRKAGAR